MIERVRSWKKQEGGLVIKSRKARMNKRKLNPMQICKFGPAIVLCIFSPSPSLRPPSPHPSLAASCYVKNTTSKICLDSIWLGFYAIVCLTSTENVFEG